jgi:hypothetical protein
MQYASRSPSADIVNMQGNARMYELTSDELLAVSGGSRAEANGGNGGRGGNGSATGGVFQARVERATVTANTTGGNGGAGGAGGAGGVAIATRNIVLV